MSDLDDLAAAASGEPRGKPAVPVPRKAAAPVRPAQPALARFEPDPADEEAAYYPPQPVAGGGGVDAKTWLWLSVGLVVVLGLAFWLINRDTGTPPATDAVAAGSPVTPGTPKAPATAVTPPPAVSETDPLAAIPTPDATAGAADATKTPAASAVRPGWGPLEDVEDPADAIDVYHLKRVSTGTIEFKIRNKSKRGVYVRALEFFAETNDRVPLGESITFWLAPGGIVPGEREIAEMAKRLGDDEGVTAVVQDAEFSDAMPDEIRELMAEADAGTGAEAPEEAKDASSSKKKQPKAADLE